MRAMTLRSDPRRKRDGCLHDSSGGVLFKIVCWSSQQLTQGIMVVYVLHHNSCLPHYTCKLRSLVTKAVSLIRVSCRRATRIAGQHVMWMRLTCAATRDLREHPNACLTHDVERASRLPIQSQEFLIPKTWREQVKHKSEFLLLGEKRKHEKMPSSYTRW